MRRRLPLVPLLVVVGVTLVGVADASPNAPPHAPPPPRAATAPAPHAATAAKPKTSSPDLAPATRNIEATLANQTRGRGLPAYVKAMGGLADKLRELSGKDDAHWIDVGGGFGNAQRAFLAYGDRGFVTPPYRNGRVIEPEPNPQRTRMTLLDLEPPPASPGIHTVAGRLETMNLEGMLGSADVITDNIAAMSYSNRPDIVLAKELSLLKPNGKLFLGLGQSADTFAPAVDSFVVTADGRMKSYGAWLKENPTLHVVDRTRVHKDIEDVSPTYHHAYEVSRKPGVTPVVPELETVFFEAGGPPRVILVEKGSLLAHNPRVAEERSAETLAARTKEVSGPDATGHFLDLFRGGALSSPLASAVRDNGRAWVHLGPVAAETVKALEAGELGASARFGTGTNLFGALRGRPAVKLRVLGTHDGLAAGSASLVTDSGHFLASTAPTAVLRHYLDALAPGGEILIDLGRTPGSRVLTSTGKHVPMADWLSSLEGLSVKTFVRRGQVAAEDETLVRITVKDIARAKEKLPVLEAVGASSHPTGGSRFVFREPGASSPKPVPPTRWQRFVDYAWGR